MEKRVPHIGIGILLPCYRYRFTLLDFRFYPYFLFTPFILFMQNFPYFPPIYEKFLIALGVNLPIFPYITHNTNGNRGCHIRSCSFSLGKVSSIHKVCHAKSHFWEPLPLCHTKTLKANVIDKEKNMSGTRVVHALHLLAWHTLRTTPKEICIIV